MGVCSKGDLFSEEYLLFLSNKYRAKQLPLCGTLELTPRCNFRCKMCYVRLQPRQMKTIGAEKTAREWTDLVGQAVKEGTLLFELTGGEVFLRPDFFDIYRFIVQNGGLPIVLSNASLLDEEKIRFLAEYPPYLFSFTMYGASNETYKKLCGIENGFDTVIRNFHMLKEAKIKLEFKMTLTKENIADYGAVREIANRNGYALHYDYNIRNPIRGAHSEGKELGIGLGNLPVFLDKNYHARHSTGPFIRRCGAYHASFFITWDGKMSLCATAFEPFTLPWRDGFRTAWKELCRKLDADTGPPEYENCDMKPYCNVCIGRLMAETGSSSVCSPVFCERARLCKKALETTGNVS